MARWCSCRWSEDGVGEQSGVEDATDDGTDAAGGGERQQFGQTVLVEQGVAAGEEDGVDVRVADEAGEQLGLVHANADRSDDSLVPHPCELRVGLVEGLRGMSLGVVEVDDVYPVQAKPLQAVLDRPAHAVGTEVSAPAVGGGHGEAVGEVVACGFRGRDQDAADHPTGP